MEEGIRLNIRIADRTYALTARPDLEPKIREAVRVIEQAVEKRRQAGCVDTVDILTMVVLDQTMKNLLNA